MRELTSKPRAVLIGASLTTILLSLVVILGLAYIVSPLPDSSQKQGVVATLASMVTPNDMIFTLPAPTVVTHDLSCPWLKDTRTKTCNGQRGYKVVGTSLISCGGCTDYTTPDTKKAGVQ